ncbi:MAG: RNA ligase family protein, partial [Verrucomicrobiota bacterium]
AGWRVCGENLFAEHSIRYTELLSYFYLFSVWNEKNETLSWDETVAFAEKMRLPTPQELYRGVWDAKLVRDLSFDRSSVEGYVVRLAGRFSYPDFSQSVAKNVRYAHVNTDEHWMHQEIKQNLLRANSQHWVNL